MRMAMRPKTVASRSGKYFRGEPQEKVTGHEQGTTHRRQKGCHQAEHVLQKEPRPVGNCAGPAGIVIDRKVVSRGGHSEMVDLLPWFWFEENCNI